MDTVNLWHGTTVAAAQGIEREGFRAVDTQDIVATVAYEHGVDPSTLLQQLTDMGRFVVGQQRRDDSAWFAASEEKAMRWAQRSPEARWEALWAVWCLKHRAMEPWADPRASAWHLMQMMEASPAVVLVRVPVDRLLDRYHQPVGRDDLQFVLEGIAEDQAPETNVAYPIPPEWIVNWKIVDRSVPFTAAAGLLGISRQELSRRVDTEELPRCRAGAALQDFFWTWREFAPYLDPMPAPDDPHAVLEADAASGVAKLRPDDDVCSMASLIRLFSHASDIGLELSSEDVCTHIKDGDIFEWLERAYPPHLDFPSLDRQERGLLVLDLQEVEKDDKGGKYGVAHNGFNVLNSYLAYLIGRMASGDW
ncbi:MAG TPA: hypothetical protein VHT30_11715 [Acidimicrobiales bacterium]|jgi:hypothetical protein|nr:hypothetical protein [Acidimicrobiales bacterium]